MAVLSHIRNTVNSAPNEGSPGKRVAGWAAQQADSLATAMHLLMHPFPLFMLIYLGFFAMLYSSIPFLLLGHLRDLSTNIVGFLPSGFTALTYLYGAAFAFFGYHYGKKAAAWVPSAVFNYPAVGPSAGSKRELSSSPRDRSTGSGGLAGRLLAKYDIHGPQLVVWLVYLGALGGNVLQLVLLRRLPLFDIASRWEEKAVLVWIATLQIWVLPALVCFAKTRRQHVAAVVALLVSAVALSLLGARHLPAKAILAFLFGVAYRFRSRQVAVFGVVFLILILVVVGGVGAISKSGIYGLEASTRLAGVLFYSDSVGAFHNLERVTNIAPVGGLFRGKLMRDTLLAAIPGVSADYANYQLGSMLGGRTQLMINGQLINRSVSLATGILGPPYADFGFPGAVLWMTVIGLMLGYLHQRAKFHALLFAPFVAVLGAHLVVGVDVGLFDPHAFIVLGACTAAVVADASWLPLRGVTRDWLFASTGEVTDGEVTEMKRWRSMLAAGIVVVALVGAFAAFILFRTSGGPARGTSSPTTRLFSTTLYAWKINPTVAESFEKGQTVRFKQSGAVLGVVTRVQVRPSQAVVATADGRLVMATDPHYRDVVLDVKGSGRIVDEGLSVGNEAVRANDERPFTTPTTFFTAKVVSVNIERSSERSRGE